MLLVPLRLLLLLLLLFLFLLASKLAHALRPAPENDDTVSCVLSTVLWPILLSTSIQNSTKSQQQNSLSVSKAEIEWSHRYGSSHVVSSVRSL